MTHDEILRALRTFSACNLSDALDRLGISGAPLGFRPLWAGCGKIAGRAMTLKLIPEGADSPVDGTLKAIVAAEPGDVLVIDHQGSLEVNSFGGIAAYSAQRRGLVGVVIDGVSRDVEEMRDLGFPAYGKGVIQLSIRGRAAFGGYGGEIRLGSVAVRRGDHVVGDENGVVVVPEGRSEEVMEIARVCSERDERIKRWISEGVDPIEAHRRLGYEDPKGGPDS
jgi:regulator of RNase E activity RraA